MATIATTLSFDDGFEWAAVAAAGSAWAAERGIALRDAVVLLPFAQLLVPARRSWAATGGWMPRIETTQTLAAGLAPPRPPQPGQPTLDVPTDRLSAARLLLGHAWARTWRAREPGLFEQAVVSVVELTHAILRAAAALAPDERETYWQDGRRTLVAAEGPGQSEMLLARVAWEWAAGAPAPRGDALRSLRPSAWIAVVVGGGDRLVDDLLARADCPVLRIEADRPIDAPPARAGVDLTVCDDVEDEAQRSAALVLQHLRDGHAPVALIAQDRSLVRRVRALLERRRVPLQDDTGWRLSTTRAGARLMALLRLLAIQGSTDDLLDWLKAGAGQRERLPATQALERALRRRGWARIAAVEAAVLGEAAAGLWTTIAQLRGDYDAATSRSLHEWCGALRGTLAASGDAASLEADAAGLQMLDVLHLRSDAFDGAAWLDAARAIRMSHAEFSAWVDATLEQSTFIPPSPAEPQVVITPLARAMLRPFGAAVLPGTDERRLGSGGAALPLLGEAQASALGLETRNQRQQAEQLALAQLMRLPRVSLLRRRREGSEPLAASPLLERLLLALRRAGRPAIDAADERPRQQLVAEPTPRPLPVAPALLPARLSASAVEMLRTCPYRFYALQMLGLREQDELDDALEKRDYGTWLHAVLHRFHAERPRSRDAAEDRAALEHAAAAVQAEMAIDAAEFLPYAAAFERLLPHYLAWLHARDAAGMQWREGELEESAAPAEWGGTQLFGRIDRIDEQRGGTLELIDYKTGSPDGLRQKVRQPAEDTQLAFYAALVAAREDAPAPEAISASYLALDSGAGVVAVPHPDVEATARLMVEGLGDELARLREGAALPALGEGQACDYCAARGLCRRDDWGDGPPAAA